MSTKTTKTRKTIEEYLTTFKKGTAVEVSSNDEGLRGSWYTATVVKPINPTTLKIQVEYHNLLAHSHGPKKLVEQVDALLIRPIQPLEHSPAFRLMDDVDAYHNDGWWEGVVTRVYDNTRYSVFFRCSREQIDFDATHLRLHREWLRPGFWLPPFQCTSANLSSRHKRKMGESGTNGGHSAGGNGQKMRKVEVRAVERKSLYTLGKHGGMVLMKNGGESGTNGGHSAGGNGQKMRKVEVRAVERKSLYTLGKHGGMVLMKNGGESGTNGGHSAGGNGQKMKKVEVRAVEKKSLYSPSKQSGSMVLMKNGGGFGNSNHSVSVVMGRNQRICSNGVHSESGVSRNVTSKDPRKKAANHTSGGGSRK